MNLHKHKWKIHLQDALARWCKRPDDEPFYCHGTILKCDCDKTMLVPHDGRLKIVEVDL